MSCLAVGGDDGAGFEIGFVGKTGGDAEAGLNFDLRAELDEFGGAVRREGRAAFARMSFAWNGNFHGLRMRGQITSNAGEGKLIFCFFGTFFGPEFSRGSKPAGFQNYVGRQLRPE